MCGVIVVDAESFQSTWHGRDAYIHDHCLRYRHNYALFYQLLGINLFTHRIICYLDPLVKPMAPGSLFHHTSSIFHHTSFRSTILQPFTFWSINQKPKNIYFIVYLSLSDLTFASNREGIDNPFIAFCASCLIVCAGIGGLCVASYWIDTFVL